jgi:hypothetical protein
MKPYKYPLVRRKENVKNSIHLQDIYSTCTIDDCELSIKYLTVTEAIEEIIFVFPNKKIVEDWLYIIIN